MDKNFIIFLDGILPDDCVNIDDQFDQQLMEYDIPQVTEQVSYDTIYPIFTTLAAWTPSTNLLCWNCDKHIEGKPVFIPTFIKFINSEDFEAGVMGNFCWFNCAAAYITSHINKDKMTEYNRNLMFMFRIFTGRHINYIPPSEQRHVMRKYGGCMSELEYYSSIEKLKTSSMCDYTPDYVYNYDKFSNIILLKDSLLQERTSFEHDL